MTEHNPAPTLKPAGYAALINRYQISVIPHWHKSMVTSSGVRRIDTSGAVTVEFFTATYWPGDGVGDHLEFALKYDGINLGILASLFEKVEQQDLLDYVRSSPTGKYARRAWFLYEFVTGEKLPLDDLTMGNYVDLLDPSDYFTTAARQVRRQRINDNLIGDSRFCPIVRRTESLCSFEASDLSQRCHNVVSAYPPELLKRALAYLYTKETKSSFEIERIPPTSTRTERFVALLQQAEKDDFCEGDRLVELQNQIVDPRFRDLGYRQNQNYVGETVWDRERVHYVCPKPNDLPDLMDGLIAAHKRMDAKGRQLELTVFKELAIPESEEAGKIPAVIHAATIAFGFVFLHPFEDGNGRIHRFLIHNILARRGFTPEGVMFPVSAAMLKNPRDYDGCLEAYSKGLLPLVDYTLDEDGRMTVHNDTGVWYRYIDLTPQAEALFKFIQHTIDTELTEELVFLVNYDKTKSAIQEIVDMPDRLIDLFIRFCLQNNGRLSETKRLKYFDALSEPEINKMEQAVKAAYRSKQ